MKKWTALLIFQYFAVVFVLMLLYRGGNYFEPDAGSFVFYKNYLSDLGRTHYFNDLPNPYWFLYSLTLTLVAVGVFLFFAEMSKTLTKGRRNFLLFIALISALGFAGIAVFPVDVAFSEHIRAGSIAFLSFFLAFLLLFIYRRKQNNRTQQYLFIFLILLWLAFLGIKFFAPPSRANPQALILKVMAQKSMVLGQLLIALLLLKKERN